MDYKGQYGSCPYWTHTRQYFRSSGFIKVRGFSIATFNGNAADPIMSTAKMWGEKRRGKQNGCPYWLQHPSFYPLPPPTHTHSLMGNLVRKVSLTRGSLSFFANVPNSRRRNARKNMTLYFAKFQCISSHLMYSKFYGGAWPQNSPAYGPYFRPNPTCCMHFPPRTCKAADLAALTLSLLRVISFKFPLQPHQKYDITQYGELGFS